MKKIVEFKKEINRAKSRSKVFLFWDEWKRGKIKMSDMKAYYVNQTFRMVEDLEKQIRKVKAALKGKNSPLMKDHRMIEELTSIARDIELSSALYQELKKGKH